MRFQLSRPNKFEEIALLMSLLSPEAKERRAALGMRWLGRLTCLRDWIRYRCQMKCDQSGECSWMGFVEDVVVKDRATSVCVKQKVMLSW